MCVILIECMVKNGAWIGLIEDIKDYMNWII